MAVDVLPALGCIPAGMAAMSSTVVSARVFSI